MMNDEGNIVKYGKIQKVHNVLYSKCIGAVHITECLSEMFVSDKIYEPAWPPNVLMTEAKGIKMRK